MAYYSKYTGKELEERLDRINDIPALIDKLFLNKEYLTELEVKCLIKEMIPLFYKDIPIDNKTIYWDNGVLKSVCTGEGNNEEEEEEDYQCLWELREHNGQQYIYSKLPVVTQYGITIYGNNGDIDLPSLYAGLPIDGQTIYWDNGVLKSLGGGGEGLDEEALRNYLLINGYVTRDELPSLNGYATESWVLNLGYIGPEGLKNYVDISSNQDINGKKNFKSGISINGLDIYQSQDDVIYLDANLVVRGGITMYSVNEADIPSIIDYIPTASTTTKGIASFDESFFTVDSNGKVSLINSSSGGIDETELEAYLTSNNYAKKSDIPSLVGYATQSWVNTRIDSLINGAPAAYDTLKEIADVLQGNVNSIGDIITALGTKWTQDNTKIANWDTAYSWGNHANAGYALKSYVDDTFVTLGTTQTITGEKNFTGGIKVNGSPIYYDSTNKYWKLEGDLLVTGGVTMYGSDSEFTPSTIMDAIQTDGVTIRVNPTTKNLEVIGNLNGATTLGGLSNVGTWADSVADVDRIMYQAAGSSNWVSKNLSDLELKGDYLPLSGGTINGPLSAASYGFKNNKNIYLDSTSTNDLIFFNGTLRCKVYHAGNLTKLSQLTDDVVSGNYLPISTYTASDILSKLLTVDGSGSGLDADTLDGYHANVDADANTVALRDESGALSAYGFKSKHYQKTINAEGWYRIYTGDNSSKGFNQVFLQIGRTYSKSAGESYSYSISVASQKVSVTRLSGTYNTHLITKIRIAKDTSQGVWYIDYYRTSATSNPDCISGVGSGTFQTPTLVEEVPLYSCEFDTGYGCKSETYQISDTGNTYQVGFIGNLNGNALSATKLETPRTIWGQSFDGSANVTGDLVVGNGDIYLSNNKRLRVYPTSGSSIEVFRMATNNSFIFGNGASSNGYNTYLYGTNLYFRNANGIGIALNSSGNVLIGTDTDSGYKLDVNGTIHTNSSLWIDNIEVKKSQDDVLYIDANVVVRGGITMYGTNSVNVPTIMDAIATDNVNLKVVDGVLTFVGQTGGGVADSVAWSGITGKPTTLSGYGITDAKISNGVITLGGNTITPLTSHQTIYNLTLQAGSFSAVTFDPNGAAKTVNIPTTTSHISEGTNLYYTDARAQAAITGGASTIKTSNLTKSRALISNSSGKVAVSAVTSTELGYLDGVTSAIQTQLNGKLSLAGGELTGALSINTSVENSGLSISYNGTPIGSLCTNGSTFEMFNAEGYGITTLGTNLYALVGWNRYTILHSDNISSYNAGSATKLQTARTIWGQSFDGTGNVYGDLVVYGTSENNTNAAAGKLWFNGIPNAGYGNGVYITGIHHATYGRKRLGIYQSNDASYTPTWNEVFTILPNGNIGIGTISPSQKLEVNGHIFANMHYFKTYNDASASAGYIGVPHSDNNNIGIVSTTSSAIEFITSDYSVPRMIVMPNGNVGIGTANPELKLHVAGTMRSYYVSTDKVSATANNSVGFSEYSALNYNNAWFANEQAFAVPYNSVQVALGWSNWLEGQGYHTRYTISSVRFNGWGGMSLAVGANDEGTYRGCTLELWGSGTASVGGNLLVSGGITMYSDQRKKTILNHVELSLKDIANAPLIEHYYNSDVNKITHVGSIAQYWASMNDWFCKLDNEGFYTMEIQNCALASAISIARELDRYESKTDKTIKQLKKRICQLEEEVERLRAS